MPTLDITLFGAPRVARDGVTVTFARRKSLALLAYLAVTRQPHGRDALATLLWPDADAERARAGLRRTLVDLNQALGKGWVEAEGDRIALRAEPGLQSDVGRFHDAITKVAAHSHPPHRLCDACLANLSEAAGLYTADFLAGFTLEDAVDFDDWQSFQSESLRLELAVVLEKLAIGLAGRQQWEAAIGHARRWLALDPLHEPAHRLLMQLHAWASDRAAAVRQYQDCVKVLQEELGIAPEPETSTLFEAICGGSATEPAPALPLAFSPTPTHNLPPDPTPFIGREAELAHIAERLADPACRLLTILGPGGMGKTRLAIQAARSQTDVFAHGVFFVDLAPVSFVELLAATIVQALPVASQAAVDVQTHLLRYLRDKHLLLLLDNFEHLAEGGAELLPKLLAAAPKLKLLVTSRSRLNLREEWLAPLEGMQAPPDEHVIARRGVRDEAIPHMEAIASLRPAKAMRDSARNDSGLLEHYSATALFLACVRRLRPGCQPTDDDARQIAHICRLLDGIPLAIELAAVWHRSLPLNEIARELERGLSLLTTKARDVPERQRSMTATFDYSWKLLTPPERSILRQASIFRGGFTRDAAEAVMGASLADLGSLTDASWISLGASGRYELHELTHQYCAAKLESEHLAQTGETADQVRDRHATYYRTLLLARQGEFHRRPGAFTEIGADYPNLLVAWNWFVARDDLEAVRTMIPGLFWKPADGRGQGRPFKSLLEICALKLKEDKAAGSRDFDRSSERALVQATALATLLDAVYEVSESVSWESWQAWVEEAKSLQAAGNADDERWIEVRWLLRYRVAVGNFNWANYAESADQLRTLLLELDEDRFRPWPYTDEARCCWQIEGNLWLGYDVLFLGQYEEAQRLAEQSIALAEQSSSQLLRAEGLGTLAMALIYLGDCRRAERHAREQLRIYRSHKNRRMEAASIRRTAQALAGQGDYVRARACLRRILARGGESGGPLMTLHHLGGVELALGNLAQAKRFYQEMMTVCEGWDLPFGLAAALTGLARVALAKGGLAEAQKHLRRALSTPPRSRAVQHTIEAIAAVTELRQIEGQWEAAAGLCAALLSWPATPIYAPETVQYLRDELTARSQTLETHLTPEAFATAVVRGRNRQIDEVVAELAAQQG